MNIQYVHAFYRAMLHLDNAYKVPNVDVRGYCCKTNIQSNTAFRGFGGPQVRHKIMYNHRKSKKMVFVSTRTVITTRVCVLYCVFGYFNT